VWIGIVCAGYGLSGGGMRCKISTWAGHRQKSVLGCGDLRGAALSSEALLCFVRQSKSKGAARERQYCQPCALPAELTPQCSEYWDRRSQKAAPRSDGAGAVW